ncbi:hypothetical protein A0U91_01105 [Acetobacter persici]|nr:hypothetical protein A0U91_01105 [Acetobacter persici]
MSLCPTVFSQTEFAGLPDADFDGVKVALSGAHPATSEGPHEKWQTTAVFSAFWVCFAHQNAVSCLKSRAGIDLSRFDMFGV